MTSATWTLRCSACDTAAERDRASVCGACGQPLFAQYAPVPKGTPLADRWDAWRYAPFMPLEAGEVPVSLGEGLTPMIEAPALAAATGVRRLWIKDESQNPTVSFKARGMSAAVTRAKAQGYPGLVVPTAGNAGAALAAYGAAAGLPVRVFAPRTTPRPILDTIEALGATLVRIDGHIGDAGKLAIAYAAESGYFNVSTLREPYRVEGMKTMGFEMAEQLGWRLPDALVYPTGGGEGTIGIWKAINELMAGGWLPDGAKQPRYVVAQAAGCAPIARAFAANEDRATPWVDPVTYASGLRVPSPLGDRLLLRVLRETHGIADTATEEAIRDWTLRLATATGIDAAPEGGCALSVLHDAVTAGTLSADAEVVVFNTGSGASYRA
ncbi:threonine synthase [Gemmatimonas sp.]|uniref:threonine synthase n=1 Tax=Gemmatimonas sp. TaxID=1962908 RepID=UPI00286E297B|nr:threonine synthase [Gemmatimonas sp.]